MSIYRVVRVVFVVFVEFLGLVFGRYNIFLENEGINEISNIGC